MKKRFYQAIVITFLTALITIVLGELVIAKVNPQTTLVPRLEFSKEYGFKNYSDTRRVHERRGIWRFVYTTNQYGNRGKAVPISNEYAIPNLVVLGDSYSFGDGVNDGEEYSAIMANALSGKYNVTNLAVGGWGLTQNVRRYYEFGQLYSPTIVILQFCNNDLGDNVSYPVTVIEEGKFKFVDSNHPTQWAKKYLGKSFIQRSQIYHLLRHSVYLYFAQEHDEESARTRTENAEEGLIPINEQYYIDLLHVFAADLHEKDTRLLVISVNGHLENAAHVKKEVLELEANGLLNYIEVVNFFEGVDNFGTLEGHTWGKKAHQIIGAELSNIILEQDNSESQDTVTPPHR